MVTTEAQHGTENDPGATSSGDEEVLEVTHVKAPTLSQPTKRFVPAHEEGEEDDEDEQNDGEDQHEENDEDDDDIDIEEEEPPCKTPKTQKSTTNKRKAANTLKGPYRYVALMSA